MKEFQTSMIPNAITTLPIPFTLTVANPGDCPDELRLSVGTSDAEDRISFFSHGDVYLTGEKSVHFDEFERIPVYSQLRSF